MPDRILVTCSRPRDALALLDEIIAVRAERDRATRRADEYERMLIYCGVLPRQPPTG